MSNHELGQGAGNGKKEKGASSSLLLSGTLSHSFTVHLIVYYASSAMLAAGPTESWQI